MFSRIWHYTTRERDKGDRRVPLVNPRGPGQAAEWPEGGPVRQKIAEALTAGRGEAQGCAERA